MKKSLLVFFFRTAGIGLLFILNTTISRCVGVAEYGIFNLSITIAAIGGLIAPLGWPTAIIRFIAEYRAKNDLASLKGIFVRANQTTFFMALLLSGLCLLLSRIVANTLTLSLLYASLLIPISSFVTLRQKSLQGMNAIFFSMIPDELLFPLITACCIIFVSPTTAGEVFIIYVIFSALTMLISTFLLLKVLKPLLNNIKAVYNTKKWHKITSFILTGNIGLLLINRVDRVIIGTVCTPTELGIYSASQQLSTLTIIALSVMITIASPLLSKAYSENNIKEFIAILKKSTMLSSLFGLAVFTIIFFFARNFLSLYGNEFIYGENILKVLLIGQLIKALFGPIGIALILSGKEKTVAVLNSFSLLINILANVIIIPVYGIYGGALVSVLTFFVLNTMLFFALRRSLSGLDIKC